MTVAFHSAQATPAEAARHGTDAVDAARAAADAAAFDPAPFDPAPFDPAPFDPAVIDPALGTLEASADETMRTMKALAHFTTMFAADVLPTVNAGAISTDPALNAGALDALSHAHQAIGILMGALGTVMVEAEVAQVNRDHRFLRDEMPRLRALMQHGAIEEESAFAVAQEAQREPELASAIDDELAGRLSKMKGAGHREWRDTARTALAALDPSAMERRAERAKARRRVTFRALTDGMCALRAVVPAVDGTRAFASLQSTAMKQMMAEKADLDAALSQAEATGESPDVPDTFGRTLQQHMADALLTLTTGHAKPESAGGTLNIIMTERALLEPAGAGANDPAIIHGYRPVPPSQVRDLIRDHWNQLWIRRLFTHPTTGELEQMDARTRCFTGAMAELIMLRANGCEAPYCNTSHSWSEHPAAAMQADHVTPVAAGGRTTLANGAALDASCNLAKGDRMIARATRQSSREGPPGSRIEWQIPGRREPLIRRRHRLGPIDKPPD